MHPRGTHTLYMHDCTQIAGAALALLHGVCKLCTG